MCSHSLTFLAGTRAFLCPLQDCRWASAPPSNHCPTTVRPPYRPHHYPRCPAPQPPKVPRTAGRRLQNFSLYIQPNPNHLERLPTNTSTPIDTTPSHVELRPINTSSPIVDYTFPKTHLRIRRAAHNVANDSEYLCKYEEALSEVMNLPHDDPRRSYFQQGNAGSGRLSFGSTPMRVHGSWFFAPWHRCYLHFLERILGKLIRDDTFALPFWNYDSRHGMTSPTILDYKYSYGDHSGSGLSGEPLIDANVQEMGGAFRQSLPLAELFMGDEVRANSPGRLEMIHGMMHQLVGSAMAGLDPVFDTHSVQANADRLWHLFHTLRGNRPEFLDAHWLDFPFVFCDENGKRVRVTVRDSLSISKFCYAYEEVPFQWNDKVSRKKPKSAARDSKRRKVELDLVPVTEFGFQPRKLDSVIRVIVDWPIKDPFNSDEKEEEEEEGKVEVLVTEGILVDGDGPARFDIYVAKKAEASLGLFVGSYIRLSNDRESEEKEKKKPAVLKLGITSVVEDLEAEDTEKLVVSFRPRLGFVTIGRVYIDLLDTDLKG